MTIQGDRGLSLPTVRFPVQSHRVACGRPADFRALVQVRVPQSTFDSEIAGGEMMDTTSAAKEHSRRPHPRRVWRSMMSTIRCNPASGKENAP
jgi:hypothetical protein